MYDGFGGLTFLYSGERVVFRFSLTLAEYSAIIYIVNADVPIVNLRYLWNSHFP